MVLYIGWRTRDQCNSEESVYKKLCVEGKGQRQLKIMGYCKAQEEAIAQLLTLQLLAAEAALMFWQHSWDLYMLTGDQGNISVLTTPSIVESMEEKNKDALTNLHCTRRVCFSMATSLQDVWGHLSLRSCSTIQLCKPPSLIVQNKNLIISLLSSTCYGCTCAFLQPFCCSSLYLIVLYNSSSHNMSDLSCSGCFGFFFLILPPANSCKEQENFCIRMWDYHQHEPYLFCSCWKWSNILSPQGQ